MNVTLVVVEGKPEGMEVPIRGTQFLIGRDKQCNLRPNNDLVSKLHCAFKVLDERLVLIDLKSTNGTFVNGERLKGTTTVTNGDVVKIGNLGFQVRIEQPSVVAERPASGSTAEAAARDSGTERDGDVMDWLADDENVGGHTVISDVADEPSLNSTVLDLQVDAETREMLSRPPKTGDSVDDPEGEPAKPAASEDDQKDSSSAAADILSRYLDRRR